MSNGHKTRLNNDEQFELARWLIDRYDNLRSSVSNRASIVLSADALLLAGSTFLISQITLASGRYSSLERIVFSVCVGIGILFISFSIINAAISMAFVWKTSRESLHFEKLPPLFFFHHRDTINHFQELEEFEKEYRSTSQDQMLHYALGELLLITKTHFQRYQSFRKSVRFLLYALGAILVSTLILLASQWF